MKKILALFLVILMISAVMVSCSDKKSKANGSFSGVQDGSANGDVPDIADDIVLAPEFNILVAGNMARNDFEAENDNGTTVENAIYRRNQLMYDTYGVEIFNDDITNFNTSNGGGDGYKKIYNNHMAGDSIYDAAMIGTYDVASLALGGYIHDLNDVENIDLTKDYWDQKANNDLAIGGKMFYTTGDISIVDNIYTHAMLFNKDLIEAYDLDDPYELVKSDEWTLETFGSLVKQVGEDVDQNGVYDQNDMYGLLTWNDPMLAVLASSGEKIASINENGEMVLTFYNERVLTLYDTFENIVFDQSHAYNYQYDNVAGKGTSSAVWDTNRDAIFNSNRAVFYLNAMSVVERHRDSEVDFGILPYPKLDDNQEDYGHNVSAFHSSFLCVPEMVTDYANSGAVLELLAYYGKVYLTPAYYDQTLIGKYVRDEESVEMLDIIFSTRVFDVGIYYDIGTYRSQLTSLFVSRSSISSIYETYRNSAEAKLKTLNNVFASNNK